MSALIWVQTVLQTHYSKDFEKNDLKETKRKYETQNVVEFVLDPNDFAYSQGARFLKIDLAQLSSQKRFSFRNC